MSFIEAFDPDWVSPPGETIKDALVYRDLSLDEFRSALGITGLAAKRLLEGDLAIDSGIAKSLADTLGASPDFWISREAFYRGRLRARTNPAAEIDFEAFADQLPLKDMKALGWLNDYSELPDYDAALAFFEDAPGSWRVAGSRMMEAVRFRTSTAHESNPAAVAAWLRQGVIQAREIDCKSWSPEALINAVPEIRSLVRTKDPSVFFPKLVDICRSCGVAVVFVRTPKGCRASGATHFASDDKAILQLSFRYRSDDHFWFTVFHEVGHLILHQGSPLFVEGADYESTEEEQQANSYSGKVLIPDEFQASVRSVPRDYKAIMRLARKIGVSPGVLVGQMQNRGWLRHDQMNFLKERYDWADIERIIP